jgi:hypothetical protein
VADEPWLSMHATDGPMVAEAMAGASMPRDAKANVPAKCSA